jgi:hypothetical protein
MLNLDSKTAKKSKLINKQFKNLFQSIKIGTVFTEGLTVHFKRNVSENGKKKKENGKKQKENRNFHFRK